jgi:hypothetical protein
METDMWYLILGFICWWVCGTCSFIFWWTNEFDLSVQDFFFSICIGLVLGPLAYPVGYVNHGIHSNTLIKRRNNG